MKETEERNNKATDENNLLTYSLADASRLLGVSLDTLRENIRIGKIKAVRADGELFVTEKEMRRFAARDTSDDLRQILKAKRNNTCRRSKQVEKVVTYKP